MVTAADAERGVRGVVAHEAQHIELGRRGEAGGGAEAIEERRGRKNAFGVVKEGDGGGGAVFDEILGRVYDGITDVREAGAGVEDRRVIGGRGPLPHEQPVGGEGVGDIVKIGVIIGPIVSGDSGGELGTGHSTTGKLRLERGKLYGIGRGVGDIRGRLQNVGRVVQERVIGENLKGEVAGDGGVAGIVSGDGVNGEVTRSGTGEARRKERARGASGQECAVGVILDLSDGAVGVGGCGIQGGALVEGDRGGGRGYPH